MLRQAIAVNPAHPEAHFLLGESGISAGDYPEAIRHLTEATRLRPSFGPGWRQLGVAQSRHGALDAAVGSVRRAVVVEPNDAEAHSVLGGIYRRKARSHYDGTGQYDMVTLRQARDAYAEASRIERWNTYPRMNVVRLDLQLARDDEVKRREVLDRAGRLVKLANHSAEEEGDEDQWKWFDLADALAFTGKTFEALDAARKDSSGSRVHTARQPASLRRIRSRTSSTARRSRRTSIRRSGHWLPPTARQWDDGCFSLVRPRSPARPDNDQLGHLVRTDLRQRRPERSPAQRDPRAPSAQSRRRH